MRINASLIALVICMLAKAQPCLINIQANPSRVICSGHSATLTASGASTYTWSPASSLSSHTGSVVIASPSVTTVYTVTATSGACSSSTEYTVLVNPKPNPPRLMPGENNPYVICQGVAMPGIFLMLDSNR